MAKPTKCERCGRENDPSFAFCLDCGQPLRAAQASAAAPASCASCGAALQPGFRFCGICGKPVGAPAATPRVTAGPTGTRPEVARVVPPPLPRLAAQARFRLTTVRYDGGASVTFELHADEVVCGRLEGEVRLGDDATVSPRHARFSQRDGALHVEDLGSVNGTFLRLRAPCRLSVGDELRAGRQLLRLEPLPHAPADGRGVRAWGAPDPGCRFRLSQLLEGGGIGDVFPLRDGENVLGRDAGEVSFPADRYVSARHAVLAVSGDEVTLSDAGSSNGTFVKLHGPVELSHGDQLLVGGQLLRVDEEG